MFKKEGEEWKYKKDKHILQMKTAMSEIKKKYQKGLTANQTWHKKRFVKLKLWQQNYAN